MKFPESINLKTSVNGLEDAIIVISGPALAVSGILAGVDLLTGGHILQQVTWLALVWAICLLLTLDFQVLALGARAHLVYLSKKPGGQKVLEIVLAFAIAASISFVSIQMQSIIARVNVSGLTIDQAAAQLGINTIWLIWERSALVLVLIFMSGWFREQATLSPEKPETASVPSAQPAVSPKTPPAISDETVQLILAKLAKLDELEQRLAQPVMVIEQPPSTLQIAAPASADTSDVQVPASDAEKALASGLTSLDKEGNQPVLLARFQSKEAIIADILQRTPGASAEQVAQEAQCNVRTAAKWLARLQQEPGA